MPAVPEGAPPPSRGPASRGGGTDDAALRIAFFTDTFAPTHDGVARVTDTLARSLVRAGHHVTVFTVRTPGSRARELRPDGVEVRRHLSIAAPGYAQYRVALGPWARVVFGVRQFDVVHIHTPGFVGLAGWLAARAARLPTVGTYHTNLPDLLRGEGRSRTGRAFFRSWARFSIDLCRWCDLSTAPTATAVKALGAPTPGRLEPRVIANGVDAETFRPGVATPDWRLRLESEARPLVTFVGRWTRDKGVLRFLDAIARIPADRRFTAVIAGEGPLGAEVERRCRFDPALSATARCVGPVAEPEKPALFAQSRVFVLPSLSDTSSVALLEAMACGTACVVTERGGPGEIGRRSGAVLLVDPEDPRSMAAGIEGLLCDELAARALGASAREWVTTHAALGRMTDEFVEAYRTVLHRSRRTT